MHSALEGTPSLLVADCGVCDGCGGLTVRGTCQGCQRRETAERVAHEASIRPFAVVVGREGEEIDRLAVLPVPEGASRAAHQVAEAVAALASVRLAVGDSLDFALARVAAGRDLVTRTIADIGTTLDRKTVAAALAELVDLGVLDRVGQLGGWRDHDDRDDHGQARLKHGAYVYALRVRCRKLGDRFGELRDRARDRLAGGSPPLHAAVRGMGLPARVAGALSAFITRGQPGDRNRFGRWVVDRSIEAGLSEGETRKVMEIAIANVDQSGHRYTAREAQATVRSRYRKLARRRVER